LDKKERHELISKFRLHRFSPGEIITAEGAFNDALYVVEEGDVDIWITRGLSKKRFAGVLGAGQSFGRLDLSHPAGEPVFASLKAKSNASVWILSGPVFHEYIEALSFNSSKNSSKKANAEQLKKILKAQSLFQNIADDKFDFLAQKAFKMTVNPGEAVVRQGSVGDYFYVIQDGEFEVYNTRPGKLPKLVDNLRAGHSFGSWSLLYDTPRAATVKSKSKGIVWAIDRHTFRQVIGPGPSYMQEAFDKNASVEVNGQKFMTSDDLFKAIRSSVCLNILLSNNLFVLAKISFGKKCS
jgi:CRP-like cAMP-binding protein